MKSIEYLYISKFKTVTNQLNKVYFDPITGVCARKKTSELLPLKRRRVSFAPKAPRRIVSLKRENSTTERCMFGRRRGIAAEAQIAIRVKLKRNGVFNTWVAC